MADETLTYREIADRLGISLPAAKMRVKRAQWPVTKGNDGKARVTVPDEALDPNANPPRDAAMPAADDAPIVELLKANIGELRDELTAAQTALDDAHQAAADERAKLLADARLERDQSREERERQQERMDALADRIETAARIEAEATAKMAEADAAHERDLDRMRRQIADMESRSLWARIMNRQRSD